MTRAIQGNLLLGVSGGKPALLLSLMLGLFCLNPVSGRSQPTSTPADAGVANPAPGNSEVQMSDSLWDSYSAYAHGFANASRDKIRQNAERIFADAEQLRERGTPEALQEAIDKYTEALKLYQTMGDKVGEAACLHYIGLAYYYLGEKQTALNYYNQALPLFRAVGDKRGEARTLRNIGIAYDNLGEKQIAIDYYNQALPLFRAVGNQGGEANTLNSIGIVYSNLGQKQTAIDYYNQALPLWRTVGNQDGEANTLNSIGIIYDNLGEKQTAIDYYNQALLLWRAVGNKGGEVHTLNSIGLIYSNLGEKQTALDYYNQALPLSRALGDKREEALTLQNIGLVYSNLGEKQTALDYYNQALPLSRAVGDKRGEAYILNNIGAVYDNLGEKQKVLDYYNQILPLFRAVGDKSGEALALNNIGIVYDNLGEKQTALNYYNQALPLYRAVGNKGGEALALNNIGKVYSNLGEKQTALNYYNQVLPMWRALGNKGEEAFTLFNLAELDRDLGNLNESLTHIEASIKILENLRTKVASSELRASYFASKQYYYEFYIDLLMQMHKQQSSQGYDAQALHISERARARSLLDLLTEAHADISSGVDPKLVELERTLQQQLDAIEKRRIALLSGNPTDSVKKELDKQASELLTKYQEIKAQIRATSPHYAALTQPQPLTLSEIQQQVLDEDTLLLQYSLGEKRSYLWAVSKSSIASYELPARAVIEKVAREFQNALTSPAKRNIPALIAKASDALSQIILKPIAEKLGDKRLLVVADGALQYIPFSALSMPQNHITVGVGLAENHSIKQITSIQNPPRLPAEYVPLIVDREIVTLPSASTLAILRRDTAGRKPAPKTVAVLADPVFETDDDRLQGKTTSELSSSNLPIEAQQFQRASSDAGVKWTRLPFTRAEAEAIMALLPEGDRVSSFDFAASRAIATSPDLSQYRIIHFATHGFANSEKPELSGIVLSLVDEKGALQNGYLRLHDIFNLNLPAELVVLSACQTGLGKEIKGEGLVGLTRGFMYAGATRVVVSLWNVNDQATSELMVKFYQKMLKDKLAPAAALRAAQIEMWKQEKWKSPYYWAAFGLQGEWR